MVRKLAKPSRMRVGTWNVESLMGKLQEVVGAMIRRHVNILCVQETK
jgi:exonuclease III